MRKMGRNRCFSQYLLNVGILNANNISEVLPKAACAAPQLHVLAIQQHLLSETQVGELSGEEDGTKALEDNKMLSGSQIDGLKKAVPNRDARIAQVVLDERLADLKQIDHCFRAYDNDEVHPIREAVETILHEHEDMNPVDDIYGEYMEMLVGALQRFMQTDAVILPEHIAPDTDGTHFVSQSMNGQISVAAAILAKDKVFLDMASRYSGEELTEVDELAEDSLAEFINVLNGLYIVNLSGRGLDMDLDMPKYGQNVSPMASSMIAVRVVADFGAFVVYLAEDEFIY